MKETELNTEEKPINIYIKEIYQFTEALSWCLRKPEIENKWIFTFIVNDKNRPELEEVDTMTETQVAQELADLDDFAMMFGDNYAWGYQGNKWILYLYRKIGKMPFQITTLPTGQQVFGPCEARTNIMNNAAVKLKQKLNEWPRIEETTLAEMYPDGIPPENLFERRDIYE